MKIAAREAVHRIRGVFELVDVMRVRIPFMMNRKAILLSAVACFACVEAHAGGISLGSARDFGVLGGSTVTSVGMSTVFGSVGVSPGTAITGFPPGVVTGGAVHAGDAVAAQAHQDAFDAWNDAAAQPTSLSLTGQDLGGLTLAPGVYAFATSAQLTGILTLDAQGAPDAEFVFKIGSTLTTAVGSSVEVINGENGCSIVWQVGSSATMDVGTAFKGSVIAMASVTLNTGASIEGRAVALDGAVTMDMNSVSIVPTCGCSSDGPDLNDDGLVDGADLGALLAAWGSAQCQPDLNNDGNVDGADLGMLLAAWSSR
jgi:hypothetical protein